MGVVLRGTRQDSRSHGVYSKLGSSSYNPRAGGQEGTVAITLVSQTRTQVLGGSVPWPCHTCPCPGFPRTGLRQRAFSRRHSEGLSATPAAVCSEHGSSEASRKLLSSLVWPEGPQEHHLARRARHLPPLGIACVGVLGTCVGNLAAPRSAEQMTPSLSEAIDGASLESSSNSQGRVQGSKTISAERTLPFSIGTSLLFLTSITPCFQRPRPAPWATPGEYHRLAFPVWPWLAPVKLCMYFVWHRVYIVRMSYAKRKTMN